MKTVRLYGYFIAETGSYFNSWIDVQEDYSMLDVIRACQCRHFTHFMLVETMNKMVKVPNI